MNNILPPGFKDEIEYLENLDVGKMIHYRYGPSKYYLPLYDDNVTVTNSIPASSDPLITSQGIVIDEWC